MEVNKRVKVIGYAKRVFFNDGIEYRNFSDDLVGNQQTTSSIDGSNSNFTFQNFITTINDDDRLSKIYNTKNFSNFYNLCDLNLTESEVKEILKNNLKLKLNLDNTDLTSFAYFGSTSEFVRVSIERIINNFPAALFITNLISRDARNTISNYNYNSLLNISKFDIPKKVIQNKFDLKIEDNSEILNTFDSTFNLRNFKVNHLDYTVFFNDEEFDIIGMSNSETALSLTVKGKPFKIDNNASFTRNFHIKPNEKSSEKFFNSLRPFENNLLNRLTKPKYTATIKTTEETDNGLIIEGVKKLKFPTTDGYNIDIDTEAYESYISELIKISDNLDKNKTDLNVRMLVSESISDFDTINTCDGDIIESESQKVNKLLRVYGVNFDEVKRYIDGISLANIVTYNKINNTPDSIIKNLGKALGWDVTSSLSGELGISNFIINKETTFKGHSRGLTKIEADVELWRRLVLNSAWIWKSKGTRKAIELFFKIIGAPDGLINFNEFVYLVDKPIDIELFKEVLKNNDLSLDLNNYLIDSDGFPKFKSNTSNMYFQKGGQWYRETFGENSNIDVLTGNNPHAGPYDSGKEYINQLSNLIPSFNPFTLTATTITNRNEMLFTNYNDGYMNNYNGDFFIELTKEDGTNIEDLVLLTPSIDKDSCPSKELTECGCDPIDSDSMLVINLTHNECKVEKCAADINQMIYNDELNLYFFNKFQYLIDGTLSDTLTYDSIYGEKECCTTLVNGIPYPYSQYDLTDSTTTTTTVTTEYPIGTPYEIVNHSQRSFESGNVCCKNFNNQDPREEGCGCTITCGWTLRGPSEQDQHLITATKDVYMVFRTETNEVKMTFPLDSCVCPSEYGEPEIITDAFTNIQGYGCKVKQNILDNDEMIKVYEAFNLRAKKETFNCDWSLKAQPSPQKTVSFTGIQNLNKPSGWGFRFRFKQNSIQKDFTYIQQVPFTTLQNIVDDFTLQNQTIGAPFSLVVDTLDANSIKMLNFSFDDNTLEIYTIGFGGSEIPLSPTIVT